MATAAVEVLEGSEHTNTGRGSALNEHGEVECDAVAMMAPGPSPAGPVLFGAVGAVRRVGCPGVLAATIARTASAEETDGRVLPILLVGEGAEAAATESGVGLCDPQDLITPVTRARFDRHCETLAAIRDPPARSKRRRVDNASPPLLPPTLASAAAAEMATVEPGPGDTIGVVAVDREGRSAAIASSGGIPLKRRGRVGQAASAAGAFAGYRSSRSAAVVSTGVGEELLRTQLASSCVGLLLHDEGGMPALGDRLAADLFLRSPALGPAARRQSGVVAVSVETASGQTR